MIRRRDFLAAAPLVAYGAVSPPPPFGALPSERQLHWHEMQMNAFLHFTVNTFTDKEWGYGDEAPGLFAPSAFDADAILRALKAAEMRGVILTCKHHDGFCLWPTRTTTHASKFDYVRAIADAARQNGLEFGVYVSPWDRNTAKYGSTAYIEMYRDQLRELLTGYGPIYCVWHDGANGGDGFYGGAREKRLIDKRSYYDWPKTWELVRSLQPNAVIFSDVGPDIRWVGNENGIAHETCWATYEPTAPDGGAPAPGYVNDKEGQSGHRNGSRWLPAECDVSIRPGWFFHERENARVKTREQLLDLYYKSVGRGANLLLNVPPDRRGVLHEADVASLKDLGDALRATFRTNLASRARVTASHLRGPAFAARNLLDGDRYSYWSTDDATLTPSVNLDLARESTIRVVRLRENIRLGQRIDSVAVDAWKNGTWSEIGAATSIGPCRLIRLPDPITTRRIRIRVTKASACPALSEVGLF